MEGRRGFTLIELLIFIGIFSVIVVSFTAIFISVLRVYSRQTASAEVNRQSQFILQRLQYAIQRSVNIETPADTTTSTLKLRMPDTATDPTYFFSSGTVVYMKETDNGTPQALTSSQVNVTSLAFTNKNNAPAHNSVSLSFSLEYAAGSAQNFFSQNLSTAIARVSAATFDSDVVASTSNAYNLGPTSGNWKSVNNTIFFNSSNVGIGATTPTSKLQISNGDVYVDTINGGVPYGIILRSPNGTCFRIGVTNLGVATGTIMVSCP